MLKRKSGQTAGRHLHTQRPLGCLLLQLLPPLEPLADGSLQLFPGPQGGREGVGKASLGSLPQSRGKIALFCLPFLINHVFASKVTLLYAHPMR